MNEILIKNMVCDRCVSSVNNIFNNLNIEYKFISLGYYHIKCVPELTFLELKSSLIENGFELIENANEMICSKIKSYLIQFINSESHLKVPISKLLSENLNYSYNYLSKVFSKHKKTTIEKYYLKLKIEKIKEFLSYDQLSIKELAYKFDYNSLSHMSNHFKKETGLSPSVFRKKNIKREGLNHL
jgi:AraC-like DNA-binding protein